MEQQVAPTLWLPPGTCFLNPVPTMQLQPTSSVTSYQQLTQQLLKQQQMLGHSVPGSNLLPGQQLMHQGHILQTPQGLVRVPPIDNLLVPSSGQQLFEYSCTSTNLHADHTIPLPLTTTIFPPDFATLQRIGVSSSKIVKKKRISPSAKRRSRMRLIAFMEAKKKQQDDAATPEKNIALQSHGESGSPEGSNREHLSPTGSDDCAGEST